MLDADIQCAIIIAVIGVRSGNCIIVNFAGRIGKVSVTTAGSGDIVMMQRRVCVKGRITMKAAHAMTKMIAALHDVRVAETPRAPYKTLTT